MKQRFLFGVLFWMALLNVPVWADKPVPPHSYLIKSSDNRFIFVMLSPKKEDDDNLRPEEKRQESLRIREHYNISGLYLNDESNTPVWSVSWYSSSIILASDGIHLIRQGPWTSSLSDEALTFFANGKELKSYQVKDFVDSAVLLPHTVSHFKWEKSVALNEKERTLTLVTLYNDEYIFDITTGDITSSHRLSRIIILAAFGVFACVLVLVTLAWGKIKSAIIHKLSSSKISVPLSMQS
jgi:hypothetical protein